MKHTVIKISFLLALLPMVLSCLDENGNSVVRPENFYQNVEQCTAALNGCYIPLRSIYGFTFLMATEAVTDLASANNSAQYDAKLMISPAGSGCGPNVWKQCYIGVRNANACVYGIENSPLSQKEQAPLVAEAKILRAFYYYILTSFFGDVPFYRDYIRTDDDLKRIAALPSMDAAATRASLIDELELCVPDRDQRRTSENGNVEQGMEYCSFRPFPPG